MARSIKRGGDQKTMKKHGSKGMKRSTKLGLGFGVLAGLFALGYTGKKYFDKQREILKKAEQQKIIEAEEARLAKEAMKKLEENKKAEEEFKKAVAQKNKQKANARFKKALALVGITGVAIAGIFAKVYFNNEHDGSYDSSKYDSKMHQTSETNKEKEKKRVKKETKLISSIETLMKQGYTSSQAHDIAKKRQD